MKKKTDKIESRDDYLKIRNFGKNGKSSTKKNSIFYEFILIQII